MRARMVLPLLATLAALGPPAAAVPAAPGEPSALRASAFGRLAAVRAAVSTGSIEAAVRGAAGLVDVRVPGVRVPRAETVPGLPGGMGEEVGALLAAVRAAGELGQRSLRVPASVLEREVPRIQRVLDRAGGLVPGAGDTREARLLEGAAERLVDRAVLYEGAAMLAATVDAVLPSLRAAAAALPPGPAADGCNVLNQAPALCVGGTGPNTYTDDYALVLDLGGDDLHLHSAGSADRTQNGLPAALTIDLFGADRYETAVPAPSGARGVQGSGYIGGIGMLVETGGNDVYRATTTTRVDQALAQGLGVAGVGILAEVAGDDDYAIRNVAGAEAGENYNERANGLGYGLIGAMTLVLDTGGSDDYLIETAPTALAGADGVLHPGNPITLGYGYSALSGPSVFSDGFGSDVMRVRSASAAVDPGEQRALEVPSATASGIGFGGLGGAGVALTGASSTRWEVEADVRAPVTGLSSAVAGGMGALGGYGGLSDAGGADAYVSTANAIAESRRTAGDDCACSGVRASAKAGAATAGFGGVGALAAVGVLHEAGGADVSIARSTATALAVAHDGHTEVPAPESEPFGAEAIADVGTAAVQGWGVGDLASGGFVLDAGASADTHDLLAFTEVDAVATADAAGTPTLEEEVAGTAQTEAMGIGLVNGYGEYVDAGGADAISIRNLSVVEGSPGPEGITSALGSVRPGGVGRYADLDGGAADSVTLEPNDPVCQGSPKSTGPYWADCDGSGYGIRA